MAYTRTIMSLLQSKNPKVHLLGLAAAFFFFFPKVFQVMDTPGLSPWQRASNVSLAAGKLLATIGLAGIDPHQFDDSLLED